MKTYLLTTTDPQHRITPVFDSLSTIRNWHMFFPGNYLIASYASGADIAQLIRAATTNCQFVITRVSAPEVDGWAPGDVWDFINNPKDSGRHPPFVMPPLIPVPPAPTPTANALTGLIPPPPFPAPPTPLGTPSIFNPFKK